MTGERTTDDPIETASELPPRTLAPAPRGARWKAVGVLAAVFLLGGVAGGAVGRMSAIRDFGRVMQGPPAEARARFRMEALRRHLDLSEDQVARIRAITEEADAERDKLMASCSPGLEDLRQRTDARVREVLSDAQRKRLDELDARRGRRGPRPGGRPPKPPSSR